MILEAGKTEIKRHSATSKHIKNMETVAATDNSVLVTFLKTKDSQDKIKIAEIKLAAFFTEHNIAIKSVEHLISVLKEVFSDSKIIKEVKLGSTKCTEIIQNILLPVETEELISLINKEKFSILLDESTDISNKKLLCLMVRYSFFFS